MALTPAEIGEAFRKCGVGRGDVLLLHADAMVAAQMDPALAASRRFDLLFDAILDVLGPEGTLLVPTFTYSATKDELFDPATTPSTVGLLSEHFRVRPGVKRLPHTIFSVGAVGKLADAYAVTGLNDCFGPGTTYDLLEQHDAWIACLGLPLRTPMAHFVEQRRGVDYRYFKTFPGRLKTPQGESAVGVRYYVRDLNRDTVVDLARLADRLKAKGRLGAAPVGRVPLVTVRASHFVAQAMALLDEDPAALIHAGHAAAAQ